MTRREAREAALAALFAYGYTPDKSAETLEAERIGELGGEADSFADELVAGVLAHIEEIDRLIGECAVGWSVSRISRVSMAVLRIAMYEMLCLADIPLRVSINEAIELSKKYDEEKAYTFVNGVLNRASQSEAVLAVGHR